VSVSQQVTPVRAVVFAYHNVGVRCLRVLRAHGAIVPLVITHVDDAAEVQWFERVADVADELGIRWIAPDDPNEPDVVATVRALAPDFLFSFYYRRLLRQPLLEIPTRGALNMHGSLLPHYRGRAPVNWAVLNGEQHTGATLHYMDDKPDAGDIVAAQSVPILPDDTAREVFDKVTVAAEICLDAVFPALVEGTASRRRNAIESGSYFGGRKPEDGRIDWSRSAQTIHDLVRAVAPPYPGAFTTVAGRPARVLRTHVLDPTTPPSAPMLSVCVDERGGESLVATCGRGGRLRIDALELDGERCVPSTFRARFGNAPQTLG
jgi:methionyl-tRNA formyltransferase